MSGNASKWLTGCGIGCGVVTLAVVAVATAGYMFIKSRTQSFERAQATASELRAKYGDMTDFCPDPDGRIRPDRMKIFLGIRETLAPARRKLESSMRGLSEDIKAANKGQDSFPRIIGLISQGFGIVPQLGEFHETRVRTLRDAGMPPGEYVYLYVVAYYSFLSKSPSDGPEFKTGARHRIRIGSGDDSGDGPAHAVERVRDLLLPMLRNQRAALEKGRAEAVRDPWADALDAEIQALESSESRVPWSDELPKPIKESLQPYRDELERSYDPLVNPLELEFWQHEG